MPFELNNLHKVAILEIDFGKGICHVSQYWQTFTDGVGGKTTQLHIIPDGFRYLAIIVTKSWHKLKITLEEREFGFNNL